MGTDILRIPIGIFVKLLYEVGQRASELNDPELNKLMIRLTIYEIADPENKNYDKELCDKILKGENESKSSLDNRSS